MVRYPFVNSVHFGFDTVLGLVQHGEEALDVGVVVLVFFASFVHKMANQRQTAGNGGG